MVKVGMLSSGSMPAHRLPAVVLSLVAVVALGAALCLRVAENKARTGFWSDEATYHSMAWSLAFDGDIRYERPDLERVYEAGYAGGPSGVFLVRNPEDGSLHFAKSFAYPLFAAPFVRLLGDNGFFFLHALLLAAMLAAGYLYAGRAAAPGLAALLAVTWVLGSAVTVYLFWMTPEWFNFGVVFLGLFLWLYKEPGPWGAAPPEDGWLTHPWTDIAAAALLGVAIFSKPPNAILLLPVIGWSLLRGRWLRGIAVGLVACLVIGAAFGATWAWIGDWNYQGGDRKQFNVLTSYPFLDADKTFDSVGISMTTNLEDFAGAVPPPATFTRDLLYVWMGRNGGMLPYMFPAVAALLAFVALPGRRWVSPHGLLAATFLFEVVAILVVVKLNWIGGGGTIGSRYFVNTYPMLFFVVPPAGIMATAVGSWAVWGLFVSQIVLNPFTASASPSMHTKRLPYTLLPTELTILHNLPFNTDDRARRVRMDDPPTFYAYFLDDDTWLREGDLGGFWVKGGRRAELVLRTVRPVDELVLEIRNRGIPNRVSVRHGGALEELRLAPDERIRVHLPATVDHVYHGGGTTYLYLLSVSSEASTIPLFDTPGSRDSRSLGVFVRPRVLPAIPLLGSE